MKVIDTLIPEVKIIEPEVFGDERGFFTKALTAGVFSSSSAATPISCKIITRSRRAACCAGCTIKSNRRRASWCESPAARFSTSRSTCAVRRPVSVAGPGPNYRRIIAGKCGSRPDLRMAFWCSPTIPSFFTRRPTFTPRSMSARFSGMIRSLPSTGRSMIWNCDFPTGTKALRRSPVRNFSVR